MRLKKSILHRTNLIGQNVRHYRRLKNVTQDQLAFQCYIRARSYISAIENGHIIPSLKVLLCIADAVSVSPAFLLVDSDVDDEFLKMYKELRGRDKTEIKRYMKYLLETN